MRKIIIDCDPGHDDAIAILLAGKCQNIEIIGITTVAGNAEVEKTTKNALKVCEIANLTDIPVAQGCSEPLVIPRRTAPDIHGDSGLDGPMLPEPKKKALDIHAVDFIISQCLLAKEPITLVPLGPLTNIAMALRKEPAIAKHIEEIVFMGGGTFGNTTPAAEFNIYVDPEAAKVVLESGIKLTMLGLQVTHQALADHAVQEKIEAIGNLASKFVSELLSFFTQTYWDVFRIQGAPIHDACCIAYLQDPSMFECQNLYVSVETKGEHTYGMTVIDQYNVMNKPKNVNVAMNLNADQFWTLLLGALQQYALEEEKI